MVLRAEADRRAAAGSRVAPRVERGDLRCGEGDAVDAEVVQAAGVKIGARRRGRPEISPARRPRVVGGGGAGRYPIDVQLLASRAVIDVGDVVPSARGRRGGADQDGAAV